MATTIQDLIFGEGATSTTAYGGIYDKLSRRSDIIQNPTRAARWVQKTVLELTRDYPFQSLQETGPIVNLISGQYEYDYSYFLQPDTAIPNLIPSFFMFYDFGLTSGISLKFKTIDTLEQMFQTCGVPAYWSRFGNQFYVAPTPDCNLPIRLRYQYQHPFSNPIELTDPILMPDEWMDIVEYGSAERGAIDLRMLDYGSQYHKIIFGDPEFERSSGGKGQPGLIFRRVSSLESDTTSQMRSLRVQVR